MKIKIRKIKKDDIDAICSLKEKLQDYHRKLDKYYQKGSKIRQKFKNYLKREWRKRNFKVFVAEIEGKIIGYIIGKIVKGKSLTSLSKFGVISDIFVEESFRDQKLGEKLVQKLISWFKTRKISHLELSVHTKNELGIKFWKKLGFKEFIKRFRLKL